MDADISPRKRSFSDTELEPGKITSYTLERHVVHERHLKLRKRYPHSNTSLKAGFNRSSSMQRDQSLSVAPNYPSFMSVYETKTAEQRPLQNSTPQWQPPYTTNGLHTKSDLSNSTPFPFQPYSPRRQSTVSLSTQSSDSSPTNTMSTFDTQSVADESPNSSPESASSSLPPALRSVGPTQKDNVHYKDDYRAVEKQEPANPMTVDDATSPTLVLGKNIKNLSLSVNDDGVPRPASSPVPGASHAFSEPSSPQREPLRSSRRKPPNLTIRTPASDQLQFLRTTPDIPSSPSQKPFPSNYQSSPAIQGLFSPSSNSSRGTHLHLPSTEHSRADSQSSWSSQSIGLSLSEVKEEEGPQASQELQEKGYTTGPIQVYDCGVFLYLEPTREEAQQFDTIINVAKEVKNPFDTLSDQAGTVTSIWRRSMSRTTVSEPTTAASERSFKSAFEWPQHEELIDNASRRQSQALRPNSRRPEYIHVPWDHNSEIINDLYPLCSIIDERVKSGQTVLVHCQLGVSRSASLVIAYGLFKGYETTFPSMYDAVKAKSRWVGPNMSLIYQLGDFRTHLHRGEYEKQPLPIPQDWFKTPQPEAADITTPTMVTVAAASPPTSIASTLDQATPVAHQNDCSSLIVDKELPPIPQEPSESLPPEPIQPFLLPATTYSPESRVTSQKPGSSGLPLRDKFRVQAEIPPHRPKKGPSGIKLPHPPTHMDLASQDVPLTPSLFSPRAAEFLASPFGLSAAGELHVLPRTQSYQRSSAVDPRSPPQKDDVGEIVRHIDDVL